VIHLTVQQLSSYLDGQLVGMASDNVQSHLAACRDCSTRFALLERIEAILSDALSIDPGEEFFRELEAEVGSRIRERGQRDKDSSTPAVSSVRFLESPAPRGADTRAATVTQRAEPSATRRRRSAAPKRSGSSSAWLAFALLAVVAGSVGVVVSRTTFVSSWIAPLLGLGPLERSVASRALSPEATPETTSTESLTAEPSDSTPPTTGSARHDWNPWEPPSSASSTVDDETAPGSGSGSESDATVDGGPEQAEPSTMRGDEVLASPDSSRRSRASSPDPFRTLGTESLGPVRAAQQLSDMANADPTATRFEAAADGWDRALDTMGGVPEQVSVRQLLADARYRAWQSEPTRARAESAKAAIKTYLLFAPSGWEREQAKTRLARLGG
jgi:anti-sigma factor RsiW